MTFMQDPFNCKEIVKFLQLTIILLYCHLQSPATKSWMIKWSSAKMTSQARHQAVSKRRNLLKIYWTRVWGFSERRKWVRIYKEDSNDLFGKMVACDLRKLATEFDRDMAQMEIKQVLLKYKHRRLSQSSSHFSPRSSENVVNQKPVSLTTREHHGIHLR